MNMGFVCSVGALRDRFCFVLQRLFDVCPEARGDLPEAERAQLRSNWFNELARNPTARFDIGVEHSC